MSSLEERIEARVTRGLAGAWYVVAKSVDVPAGTAFRARALGRNLALWRDAAGVVRCLDDYCPHRGAPLSRGEVLSDGTIACRYHGVTLDGSGTIVRVPAMPDCPLEGRTGAESFAVQEVNDGIFVYFPSVERPEPPPLELPVELTSSDYATFLCTAPWECSYRYVIDNVSDPMHGSYLHNDTFTLAYGSKQDLIRIDPTPSGFALARQGQQGQNLDWIEIITEAAALYGRVDVPLPPAGGPGPSMRVMTFVTPVDEKSCRLFFWRTRKVSGFERETWRFLYRATLEARHWYVLEQDRLMLEDMPPETAGREMLYQHDVGLTRVRRLLAQRARSEILAEDAGAAAAE